MIFVSQVSGLVENFNIRIYLYICDKYQTLHNGTTHWALPVHAIFSDLDQSSRSQQCWTGSTEIFVLLSNLVETL